jgi:hypothetical protein
MGNPIATGKIQNPRKPPQEKNNKKWVTVTYVNAKIRKITNVFKDTQIQIAFKRINTMSQYTQK